MITTIEIQEILSKLKHIELAKKRMNNLLEQVDRAQKELEQLGNILDKEYEDVIKLEQMSLRNLFVTILGDKKTQIETERQEYLQAFLHYKERKRIIELLLIEQEQLMVKINSEEDLEKDLKALLLKRSNELKFNNPKARIEIDQILKSIDRQYLEMREVHEALVEGAKVKQYLEKLLISLREVRKWGQRIQEADFFTSTYKLRQDGKSEMKNTEEIVAKTEQALAKYKLELSDIYQQQKLEFHYNLDQFNHFIDEYFNSLITDWIIKEKIYHAIYYIEGFQDRVLQIQKALYGKIGQAEISIAYLEKKKEDLILSYSNINQ